MSNKAPRPEGGVQLSAAGIIIGIVGCVIITASSVYTALKMGALPWPTIFTSITALVLLRAFGHKSLNEANITQIIMSAGSMVAGGIAFTIPGIWILGISTETNWVEVFLVALSGTLLGLVATALIRKRFVDESDLEYPIGVAAAQTLTASNAGGKTGRRLFGSMAFASVYSLLRDGLGILPAMIGTLPIPGVVFGLYNSPMMLSIGFLMGGVSIALYVAGAVFANFGLVVAAPALGLWDLATAKAIVSSLGMGLMMGSGFGVVCKDVLPKVAHYVGGKGSDGNTLTDIRKSDRGVLALLVAAAALAICLGLRINPLATVIIVLLSFVTTVMSAQSVGQTGIDPMEIFGLIVLLAVAALGGTDQVRLFFVAGIIAVACGIGGDVMSDFKTGHIIGTDPRQMWIGQVIGALLGTFVATVTMFALVSAYGTGAFGPDKPFVAAQASVVATMVSGIPNMPAFIIGIMAGIVLYVLGVPSMMIGLGVYLPFYMPLSAAIGALVKVVYDKVAKSRKADGKESQDAEISHDDNGIVIASGLLGGESIVGVIIALVGVIAGLAG